jgi:hypothetical protein
MSDIRVSTYADKIINYGPGWKSQKEWRTTKEMVQGKEEDVHELVRVEKYTKGSDYIVFICPVCEKRNKQVVYNASQEEEGRILVFRCNGCLRHVEVKRPINVSLSDDNMVHLPGPLVKE